MRPSRFRILSALLVLLLSGRAAAQSAKVLAKQGAGLFSQGRYQDALLRFEEAYAKDPRLTRMLVLIGAAHINLDHAEEAIAHYERYEQAQRPIGPEDREYLSSLYDEAARKFVMDHQRDRSRGELLLWAGRARSQLGEHPEAGELYDRYQREVPSPAERYREILARYLREHHERSLRGLQALLGQDGGRKALLLGIAEAQLHLGQLEAALDAYDRHRGEVPDAPEQDKERRRRGFELLVVRLEAPGDTPARLLLLGRAHFALDHLEQADERYGQYEREAPEPPEPYQLRLRRYREEYEALRHERAEQAARRSQAEAEAKAEAQRRRAAAEAARRREASAAAATLLRPPPAERRPIYKRWWLWTAIGAGVAAAVVIPIAATCCGGEALPQGVELHDVTPN